MSKFEVFTQNVVIGFGVVGVVLAAVAFVVVLRRQ
jgi:hypothetical protein